MKKWAVWIMAVLAAVCAAAFTPERAWAQGRYLDISLSGSYQKAHSHYSTNLRRSLGLELGIPLSAYLSLAVGHTIVQSNTEYNEKYREVLVARGLRDLPPKLTQSYQTNDTTVNAAIGVALGALRPSLFGGALWRRSCSEDTFYDEGCEKDPVTWNAGAGLSIFLTQSMRFKVSYRISPSDQDQDADSLETDKKKRFDELVSLGLTWSL